MDRTYLVYAIGVDGYKTARSDNKPIYNPDGTKKHYRGDRIYFKQVMYGQKYRSIFGESAITLVGNRTEILGQQVLLSRTLGKPAFILSYPIRNDVGAISGVLCIGTTLVDMSNEVTRVKLGKTGYAILLDRDGKVIAHGNPKKVVGALQDLSDHPVYTNTNKGQMITYRKDDVKLVAIRGETSQGWTVIIEREFDDAFNALKRAKLWGLAFLVVTSLFVTITAMFLAKLMTGPIRSLSIKADRLSMGKMDVMIDETDRSDEIGEMAKAIERMGVSIRIALKKISRDRKR
jgi:methyl-accepting chemotaxis protein